MICTECKHPALDGTGAPCERCGSKNRTLQPDVVTARLEVLECDVRWPSDLAVRLARRLRATCLAIQQLNESKVDDDGELAIVDSGRLGRAKAFAKRNLEELEGGAI